MRDCVQQDVYSASVLKQSDFGTSHESNYARRYGSSPARVKAPNRAVSRHTNAGIPAERPAIKTTVGSPVNHLRTLSPAAPPRRLQISRVRGARWLYRFGSSNRTGFAVRLVSEMSILEPFLQQLLSRSLRLLSGMCVPSRCNLHRDCRLFSFHRDDASVR
jgi:hypothetical protein